MCHRRVLTLVMCVSLCVVAVVALLVLMGDPARAAGPWYVAPGGDDGNDCLSPATPCANINGAIGKASSGDTIFVATGTYTGTGDEVVLVNKDATLSGGWDVSFISQDGTSTIDGEGARNGIAVDSGVTATIERFTVQSAWGGGIVSGGSTTLNDCTVSHSWASVSGGGINNYGSMTINNSTISGNTASNGGGIRNDGTITLNNSTVSGNTADSYGGGIHNYDLGNILTLNNSTVSGNTADGEGGGIRNYRGTVTLQNTILAENTAGSAPDCYSHYGTIGSSGYNLVGNTSGCAFTPATGDLTNVSPKLGLLTGSPAYYPLSPSSPAVDAVPLAQCALAADQRGVARPQGPACDMGAYEYTTPGPAARIDAVGGTAQRTPPFFAFEEPLQALVLDGIGSPVDNVALTFFAPASGASGTFADSGSHTTMLQTDEVGVATAATLTANGLEGSYTVTATVGGVVTPANFLLTNIGWYVSPTGNDGNDCQTPATPCDTIDGPLAKPGFSPGDTVLVAIGTYTGTGDEVVLLDKSVTLSGGWDAGFVIQSGTSTVEGEGSRRGITVNSGVTAVVEGFTVQNGFSDYGGGIHISGTLTLNHSTVSGNTGGSSGGGINNDHGTLALNHSTVSGNTGGSSGGGINNDHGTLVLNNCTVRGNTTAGNGGGISNDGTLILNHSTVSGNTGDFPGGGLYHGYGAAILYASTVSGNVANLGGGIYLSDGTMTLNSSTISSNRADDVGGGIYQRRGTLLLNNATVSANTTGNWGGGFYHEGYGTVTLQNTILAGNSASGAGPDCSGPIGSSGYNLIDNTAGCTFTPATGDLTDVDANLGLLLGPPSAPRYHPLLSGSPAIDAGNPAGCTDHLGNPLDTDQRGAARVGRCDMGAYEYTAPGPATSIYALGGTPQRTPPLFAFETSLQASVLDSVGTPVSNTLVTFAAPASGASGTFSDSSTYTTTAATDEGGVATAATFTANALAGSYLVTATVTGIVTPANFLLTNLAWYVAPGGEDANDCQTPATPCATINGALGKAGFAASDPVLVASGTYTSTDDEVVLLDKSVRLLGGLNASFTAQSGISTVDGEDVRRGMTVSSGVTATVERFAIQNGSGGGISSSGTLTLNNSNVSSNVSSDLGGGIHNADGGTLTLQNSTVSGNTGGGIWGTYGIYNGGTLSLKGSTISGNTGGGIRNAYECTMTVDNSTVSGNSGRGIDSSGLARLNNSTVSGNSAGGISNGGTMALNNSTVSGNTGGDGGGITQPVHGTLFLNNSTVSSNTAGSGGGIQSYGTVTLQNTVLAGNTADSGPDCIGSIDSSGYNLIGNTSGCSFTPATGDLLDVDPRLFVLVGLPGYHPLRPGSPAIDAGNPAGCTDHLGNPLDTDQRGTPRPLDGDGDGTAICDMGAYEVDPEHPIRQVFLPIILRNY